MKKTLCMLGLLLTLLLTVGLLCSCSDKVELSQSQITSATVDKKGEKITVKAVFTEADLEVLREKKDQYNQKLYLVALEPGETIDDMTGKQPVAQTGFSESPKFTFDVLADGNLQAHSRLHCAFVVAAFNKTTNSYVAKTNPVYISNPDVLAENTEKFPTTASIKGLHATISSDAADLGISHAVLELDPSALILDGYSENAVSYVYDGQTYYLDRGELDALDKQVSEYSAQGCTVYLRLRMCNAPSVENKALVSNLYAATDVSGKRAYAIIMDDDQSASLMAGFLDFITARYTSPDKEHGFCGALIIGRSVNESTKNNYAGSLEFTTYVQQYHALVRLAHSTLKSHYAQGRVYVSVSNNLSNYEKVGAQIDSTTNVFLDEFNKLALAGGDFDWSVAISAYAYGKGNADPMWSDDRATALELSPAHPSDFMWISQSDHFYAGERRHTIISDFEVAPGESEAVQAASYAYAYYKVLECGYIDALIYTAHTDASSLITDSGLWDVDNKGVVTTQRMLYNVFKYIDTTATAELDALARQLNVSGWSDLYKNYAAKAATRQIVSGENTTKKPSSKSRVMFSFTDGTLCNFTPDDSVSYLELSKDAYLGYPVLRAPLNRTQPQTFMGVSNATLQGSEIKGVKTVALTVCGAADVPEQGKVTIKLRMVKQGTTSLSAGNGQVVYEATQSIDANIWQTVYFDVTEFTSRVDGDDPITVSVQLTVPELNKDGKCTLLLDRVEMYGSFGVQFYEWIIIIVSIIAVLALIVGLVYLLYRKYGAPIIIANIFWNVSKGKIRLRRYKKAER